MDVSRIEGIVTTVISLTGVLGAALRFYLQPLISKEMEKQTAHFEKLFVDHMRFDHGYRGGGRGTNKERYRPNFAPTVPPEEIS